MGRDSHIPHHLDHVAEASARARPGLVAEGWVYVVRRLAACDRRQNSYLASEVRLEEAAAADTCPAVDSPAVVVDTGPAAEVDTAAAAGRDSHVVGEAGRMRHTAAGWRVRSGPDTEHALGRMPESERSQE